MFAVEGSSGNNCGDNNDGCDGHDGKSLSPDGDDTNCALTKSTNSQSTPV